MSVGEPYHERELQLADKKALLLCGPVQNVAHAGAKHFSAFVVYGGEKITTLTRKLHTYRCYLAISFWRLNCITHRDQDLSEDA